MTWEQRVYNVLTFINRKESVFFNPYKQAKNYQAALELTGKGLVRFDGARFYKKESVARDEN